MPDISVLVVENQAVLALAMQEVLQQHGFAVRGPTATEDGAVRLARAARPDIALVDIELARGSGLAAGRAMAGLGIGVVFVTAHSDTDTTAMQGIGLGWVDKPFAFDRLPGIVLAAQQLHRTGRLPPQAPRALRLLGPPDAPGSPPARAAAAPLSRPALRLVRSRPGRC
ncbi:MAG TPA: response regulator [Roseiflexaceae bacterium]|nr:response regulator [Roseiflexaceae bacterium]